MNVNGRAGTPDGNAARRLDSTMAAAVSSSRVLLFAQTAGIARTLRHRVRHPRALAAGIAALGAQTAWSVQRGMRNGSVRDRSIASSDALAQCFALAVEAVSWGSRSIPSEARWSETLGAVLTSWLGFEDPSTSFTAASLAGWLGTYAVATGARAPELPSSTGQRINEATGHVALTMTGRALGSQLVAQARELDAARAEAVAQAQRLAAERERHRQHRIIHDSALQVLEAIAGGWEVDDELVRRRIDYEIARLQRLLDDSSGDSRGLDAELSALVAKFALVGLEVELDISELQSTGPSATTEALTDATHEALMNVHKHAGVSRSVVRAASLPAGVTVRVVDFGAGFDPARPRSGFGLGESIEGRMRDVGGTAAIVSSPADGTRVELWAPR